MCDFVMLRAHVQAFVWLWLVWLRAVEIEQEPGSRQPTQIDLSGVRAVVQRRRPLATCLCACELCDCANDVKFNDVMQCNLLDAPTQRAHNMHR